MLNSSEPSNTVADKRFFARCIAAAVITMLAFLSLFAMVNWLVNPLYLYRNGDTSVSHALRDDFGYLTRIAKPHIISSRRPSGLILGDSRAEFGFSPEHPFFEQEGFNAAYSGGRPIDAIHTLAHAHAVTDLKRVVWVFNPFFLLGTMSRTQAVLLPPRFLRTLETPMLPMAHLARDANGKGSVVRHYLQKGLLISSMYQLSLSLHVLFGPSVYQGKGFLYQKTGQRDRIFNQYWVEKYGQYQMSLLYLRNAAKLAHHEPRDGISYLALSLLAKAARIAKADKMRLVLVFEPIHVAIYAAHEKNHDYDALTKSMAILAEVVHRHHLNIEIWDCSLLNKYTTESIPAEKSNHRMRWWWESSHFKNELGWKILDVIQKENKHSEICRKVEFDTIDQHVAYRKAHKQKIFTEGYPILAKIFKTALFKQA